MSSNCMHAGYAGWPAQAPVKPVFVSVSFSECVSHPSTWALIRERLLARGVPLQPASLAHDRPAAASGTLLMHPYGPDTYETVVEWRP